ncbi:putative transcriptional regulator [Escherichia coli]|nr:putative transcriptional regulator [Escherichia coli]
MIHLVNKLINFGFTRTDAQVYISPVEKRS